MASTTPAQEPKPPTGTILPPPDIREKIERTAGYVHRNGVHFENRIRESEKHNSKFSFLNPFDPYHKYYQWRLEQLHAGFTAVPKEKKEVEEKRVEVRKPKDWEFSLRLPPISALDLDVIKLTALHVAQNGQSFMLQLSQRENRNYQFDFLRPNHSFYSLFTALIGQYSKVLYPPKGFSNRFKNVNIDALMERAQQRAGYQRWYQAELEKKEAQEAASRADFNSIDWHDFAVVETITFTEADESTDLPPPANLSDLQHASLEQKREFSLFSDALRIEEAPPNFDEFQQPASVVANDSHTPAVDARPTSTVSDLPTTQTTAQPEAKNRQGAPQDQIINGMRVRQNYVRQGPSQKGSTAQCPLCKQQIPTADYEMHLRVEILSPQYTAQRAVFLERSSTTNLAIDDAANNIKRLASQRGDIFDERQEQVKRKKVVGWSGFEKHKDRKEPVDMEEQIRNIHEKIAREQRGQ